MPDKSDNWVIKCPQEPLAHQQRHRSNGYKIQVYQGWMNMMNFDMLDVHFVELLIVSIIWP